MKIVKWLAIIIVVLVVVFILIGFVLPKNYNVERSVVIRAEPAAIHTLVGELRAWDRWTPWQEADPTIVTTFGETTAGVGASGELTFTQCSPETGVVYDMVGPMFEQGLDRLKTEVEALPPMPAEAEPAA